MTMLCRAFLAACAVLAMAICGPVLAQPALRWRDGDPPPVLEGIQLGDSRDHVIGVLGKPDQPDLPDDADSEQAMLSFRNGALLVQITRGMGVTRIMLNRREAGSLSGIRVGDPLGPMLKQWGEPTRSTNTTGYYLAGPWRIVVRADLFGQSILKIQLRTSPPVAEDPLFMDTQSGE